MIKDYKNESVLRSALQEQHAALCASQGPSPRLVTGEPGSRCHPRGDLFVGDTKSHTEMGRHNVLGNCELWTRYILAMYHLSHPIIRSLLYDSTQLLIHKSE